MIEYKELPDFTLPKKYSGWIHLAVIMERFVESGTKDEASVIAQTIGLQLYGLTDLETKLLNQLRMGSTNDLTDELKQGTYLEIINRLYQREQLR